MSAALPASAPARRPTVSAGAIAVWLALQLIALLLGAWRVPLSANFPTPAERLALHEMLVMQIGSSALLFPVLLRNWRTTSVIMLSAMPFIELSAFLSMTPTHAALAAAGYVLVWLAALSIWGAAGEKLPRLRVNGMGIVLAAAWALGGAAIWYMRSEFSTGEAMGMSWSSAGWFGPILGAIAQVEQRQLLRGPWVALLIALSIALLARGGAGLITRRPEVPVEQNGAGG
jgi:hypothetical protein